MWPIREIQQAAGEVKGIEDVEIKGNTQEQLARERAWAGSEGIASFANGALAHCQRLAGEAKRLLSGAAAKAASTVRALGWKPPRVRIVLTGLPLRIRILVARQLSKWKMLTPGATRDTGFRAAVILAAVCAVLVLLSVALAPRFAARFLPSRSLGSGSTAGRKTDPRPAPAAPPPSQPAAGAQPRETAKPPSGAEAPDAKQEKPSPQNPESQRKHAAGDDLVAPDTYKYYGNRGSR